MSKQKKKAQRQMTDTDFQNVIFIKFFEMVIKMSRGVSVFLLANREDGDGITEKC